MISTADDEFGGSFTPDGDTIYYSKSAPHSYLYVICTSHFERGRWSSPRIMPFSGRYVDSDPTISPDGNAMLWTSDRPVDGRTKHDYDISMVQRTASGAWGEPQHLPPPINSDSNEYAASIARDGTLYFSSTRDGGATGAIQVYRSHLVKGTWSPPENVSRLINGPDTSAYYDLNVTIDPDQRFILLWLGGTPRRCRQLQCVRELESKRPLDTGGASRCAINTPARDYAPHLSPDGRYLFLSSERSFALQPIGHRMAYDELEQRLRATVNGSGNIYRMDLAAFDSLARASLPPDSSR